MTIRFPAYACALIALALTLPLASNDHAIAQPLPTAPPFPIPSSSPLPAQIAPVTQPEGLGFGDPGPSLIKRATSVEKAVYPELPGLPAPDITAPPGTLERSAVLVGVTQRPFVGIRLQDAVALALMRNTNLAISQASRRITRYQIVADEGAYDVHFQLMPSYTHSVMPPTSPLNSGPDGGPVTQDILGTTTSFSGLLPTGASYNLALMGQRVTTNYSATGFDPYYQTAASFGISQPLLRNRDIDSTRRQLLTDQITLEVNSDSALVQAQQTLLSVADAYWNLVYSWQNVAVQEAALRQAQFQAASNARRVAGGRLAASDVAEANAQVSAYQSRVSVALQSVQQNQLSLKSLLIADTTDPIWTANLVPVTPPEGILREPKLADALVLALHNRPEIAQIADQRKSAGVQIAYARDQLKPQLDLGVSVDPMGLAGVATTPQEDPLLYDISQQSSALNALIANADLTLPPGQQILPVMNTNFNLPSTYNGSFGSSLKSLLTGRYPTYTASLTLGIPIGNRTARGQFDEAVETDRSLQVQQLAVVRSVRSDAETAVEMLRTDAALVGSARDQRQASQQVYESEVRRRAVGRSTTFLVFQRLAELANARGNELQAQINYNRALAFFREVTGELLPDAGVNLHTLGTATLDRTVGPAPLTHVANP